ncbi:MAG: hypothetical protein ACJ8AW_50495, partial [Rhodopila sp.]
QYLPAGRHPVTNVSFSFYLADQDGQTTPIVTVLAAGEGSHTLAGAATGYTDISLGKGENAIALSGSHNTVALQSGSDIVRGGTDDTIAINGNTSLAISGSNEMVFVSGNASIADRSTGLQVEVGQTTGHVVISGFAADPTGVVDPTGGVGGFADVAAVLSALTSDDHGGTQLSLGTASALDFAGVTPSQLHAANFHIS